MVCRVLNTKGSCQLLLPASLHTCSVTAQGCGALPLLHHLMTGFAATWTLDCHLHQRPCFPANIYQAKVGTKDHANGLCQKILPANVYQAKAGAKAWSSGHANGVATRSKNLLLLPFLNHPDDSGHCLEKKPSLPQIGSVLTHLDKDSEALA